MQGTSAYGQAVSDINQQQYPFPIAHRAASAGGAGIPHDTSSNVGVAIVNMEQAEQQRLLSEALRNVEEHAYYMKYVIEESNGGGVSGNGGANVTSLVPPAAKNNSFGAVMDYASAMLLELTTSSLTPKYYYELYIRVTDEMEVLDDYFKSLAEEGLLSMKKIYEIVQYSPKAVPRLYLQIAAASAFIQTKQASPKAIWDDLITGIKCVQCPLRGLFLRSYLSRASRDKLPGIVEYNIKGENVGTVEDAYSFLLENFIETTKLWVRIQKLGGSSKDFRKRREKERIELRVLVGTNLVTLSQLDALDISTYKQQILPKIFEQILNCKDTLAQGYLMDCIIHVFSEEFLIETLDLVLDMIPKLKEKVNVNNILESIINRLAEHSKSTDQKIPLLTFQKLDECVRMIFESKQKLPSREVARIEKTLMNFSVEFYPGKLTYINSCLDGAYNALMKKSNGFDRGTITEVCNLLSEPLDSLSLDILELDGFTKLLGLLPFSYQRHIATNLLKAICETGSTIGDPSQVDQLLQCVSTLLQEDTSNQILENEEDYQSSASFHQEQYFVSRIVHLFQSDDVDTLFKMYNTAKKHFLNVDATRIKYTVVPLVFAIFPFLIRIFDLEFKQSSPGEPTSLLDDFDLDRKSTDNFDENIDTTTFVDDRKDNDYHNRQSESNANNENELETSVGKIHLHDNEDKDDTKSETKPFQVHEETGIQPTRLITCRKLFVFLQKLVIGIAEKEVEMAFKLYLECAIIADQCNTIVSECNIESKGCDFGAISYEFMAQSFLLYEDQISDPKMQERSITLIVGTLLSFKSFVKSDYEALSAKTTQYAAKLIRKPDQCRMILLCSNLFYHGCSEGTVSTQNPQRVLECLQRALKLADACMSSTSNIGLFINILDAYLKFFELECPVITDKFLSGLIALINEHFDNIRDFSEATIQAQAHYNQILQHISRRKMSPETAAKFAPVMSG